MNTLPASTSGSLHSACSAWLARDSTAILGTYSLCLFRRKPQISNAGFWEAKKGHGRWPVDLPIEVKPGDCIRLAICKPNDKLTHSPST